MRNLTVDELVELLPSIEKVLAEEGEIVVVREGKPVARLSNVSRRKLPTHAEFRATLPYQEIPSEVLIREDRDAGV